jgi:hypothetical protein
MFDLYVLMIFASHLSKENALEIEKKKKML